MAEIQTPLRTLLQDLTHELNETRVDPFEGYELLCRRLGNLGLWFDTYCSSSITSGGHARDESLDIMQIIQRNTDSAYDLTDELYKVGQLDPLSAIEAVAVGKVRHWSQSDYMEFWLNVMARMPFTGPHAAQRMDNARGTFRGLIERTNVDMGIYNDKNLSASQRVTQYMKHADAFATLAQTQDSSPISRLVRLIDTDQSLGAQTENYFARVMGTQVMLTAIAHIGDTTLPEKYPAKRLVSDIDSIVRFGGHVFDPVKRTQIILVPSEEPAT